MTQKYFVFYSPLIVLGIGLILFLLFKSNKEKLLSFIGSLVFAALAGFVSAAVVVFYITFTKNSPQGPFALAIYGPICMSVAEIAFIFYWILKKAGWNR